MGRGGGARVNRPNILYIHSHNTGRYIQPYGHAVPAPSLQRLCEQGVVFRRAFCAGPTCSPSRAALLTGQSPHSCGMLGLAHRGFSLADYSRHIVHTLRRAGYFSSLVGVQHIARDPGVIGYDRLMGLRDRPADEVASTAVEFLRDAPRQPFFLSVGFFETHRPYPSPTPAEDPSYAMVPATLPDTPETRYDMATFKASVREMDDGMGRVLGALDEAGLAENTLVICTADHGLQFPACMCNLTDHGLGV